MSAASDGDGLAGPSSPPSDEALPAALPATAPPKAAVLATSVATLLVMLTLAFAVADFVLAWRSRRRRRDHEAVLAGEPAARLRAKLALKAGGSATDTAETLWRRVLPIDNDESGLCDPHEWCADRPPPCRFPPPRLTESISRPLPLALLQGACDAPDSPGCRNLRKRARENLPRHRWRGWVNLYRLIGQPMHQLRVATQTATHDFSLGRARQPLIMRVSASAGSDCSRHRV
jgi:hypothetical protein